MSVSVRPCHLSGSGRTALASSVNVSTLTDSSPVRVVMTVPSTPTQSPRSRCLDVVEHLVADDGLRDEQLDVAGAIAQRRRRSACRVAHEHDPPGHRTARRSRCPVRCAPRSARTSASVCVRSNRYGYGSSPRSRSLVDASQPPLLLGRQPAAGVHVGRSRIGGRVAQDGAGRCRLRRSSIASTGAVADRDPPPAGSTRIRPADRVSPVGSGNCSSCVRISHAEVALAVGGGGASPRPASRSAIERVDAPADVGAPADRVTAGPATWSRSSTSQAGRPRGGRATFRVAAQRRRGGRHDRAHRVDRAWSASLPQRGDACTPRPTAT